jgi:hypothetical protein
MARCDCAFHAPGHKLDCLYESDHFGLKAPRTGDHICYISDLGKLRAHFPEWKPEYDLPHILSEIVDRNQKASLHACGKKSI